MSNTKTLSGLASIGSLVIVLYLGIGRHHYNEDGAGEAATSAFADVAQRECGVEAKDVHVTVTEITRVPTKHGDVFDVIAVVTVGGKRGEMAASVFGTLKLFGHVLNGSDVTGVSIGCPNAKGS